MENPFCNPIPIGTQLIETFALRGGVFVRLDMHLQRMTHSAAAFGFPFDMAAAQACLQDLPMGTDLRCRLTLDAAGIFNITSAPLGTNAPHWVLAVSNQRLNEDNLWLQHKSTQRALYDETRANMPKAVDEVIFLNTSGMICEGTITNIFVKPHKNNPMLQTPPLSAGVLPGVLRRELLQNGQAQETGLTLQDVQNAHELWVGNSLWGLIRAHFPLQA